LKNLNDLDTPQKRLRYFIEYRNLKKKDFAYAIGIKPKDLTPYINDKEDSKGKKSVLSGYEKITVIKELGLNPEWYKDNIGSMEITQSELEGSISGSLLLDVETKAVTFYLPEISNLTIDQLFTLKETIVKKTNIIQKYLDTIDSQIKNISTNKTQG